MYQELKALGIVDGIYTVAAEKIRYQKAKQNAV